MRRAMMRMPAALTKAGLQARMLLAGARRTVFGAYSLRRGAVRGRRSGDGRGPPSGVSFSVPLVVDARAAANWDEAH